MEYKSKTLSLGLIGLLAISNLSGCLSNSFMKNKINKMYYHSYLEDKGKEYWFEIRDNKIYVKVSSNRCDFLGNCSSFFEYLMDDHVKVTFFENKLAIHHEGEKVEDFETRERVYKLTEDILDEVIRRQREDDGMW